MNLLVAPARNNRSGRYYGAWNVFVNDETIGTTLVNRYAHKSNATRAARNPHTTLFSGRVDTQDGKALAVVVTPKSEIVLGTYASTRSARRRLASFLSKLSTGNVEYSSKAV